MYPGEHAKANPDQPAFIMATSGEVVDQYPPERLLRLFAAMREAGGGRPEGGSGLIDERA